jgi:hypothetical protein
MNDRSNKEREGVNTYQKISEAIDISKPDYVNYLSLDFTDPQYNLVDIEELDKKEEFKKRYANIVSLDLSKNSLSVLKLKGYNNLERIKASENLITKVELNLGSLKKLDLSMNLITKLFEMNSIPNIQELILNKNSITKISYEDFKPVKSSLKILEIGNNKIDFASVKEFFEFTELFGKNMKCLKSLNISDNFFNSQHNKVYKDYSYVLLHYCHKMEILNNKAVDEIDQTRHNIHLIKDKMQKNEKYDGPIIKNNKIEAKPKERKMGTYYSLSNINKEMSKYATLGKLNQLTFQQLKGIIDEYIAHGTDTGGDDDAKLEDKDQEEFEAFLEYSNVLIDSTPVVEKGLYEVIASLSVIKNGKLAHRALTYLNQRISPEKIKFIEQVISDIVIKYFNDTQPESLQASIIDGLELFLSDIKLCDCLKPAILKIIMVADMSKRLNILDCKSSEDNRKKEVYNSSIRFLSTASEVAQNITLMASNINFINAISLQIINLLYVDENKLGSDPKGMGILKNLLNIIKNMCLIQSDFETPIVKENIEKLVGIGLRDKIEQNLNLKLQNLAKNKTETSTDDSSQKESLFNRMIIFANQVRSFGALLYRSRDIKKIIRSDNSVTRKILNLLVQADNNDPIIISSACDFTVYLLQNQIVMNNEEGIFESTVANLYNLRYVLPYLMPYKEEYKNACFIAEKYGQFTISKGKPVELNLLNSEVMHNLVMSIAGVIEYFGKNSKRDSPIQKHCIKMCSELNEMNRDTALCNCLTIPNDEVKKSLVECLYALDYTEFDPEEINNLNQQTKNINLTGGIIEYVVAVVYTILTKSYTNFMSLGYVDKLEQNKDSFTLAYEILAKNQERIPHYKIEFDRKDLLNTCMIVFLYNISCYDELKLIFLDKKNVSMISKILFYEEKSFSETRKSLPIEIEKTRTGWNLESLFGCFKSDSYALSPYTYISLRVIIHIADLLMNIPAKKYEIDDNMEFQELLSNLKTSIEEREINRLFHEGLTFKQLFEIKKIAKFEERDVISLKDQDLAEEQKKFISFFPTLLQFIQGKTKQKKISHYEQVWQDKFDPAIDKLKYFTSHVRSSSLQIDVDEIKDKDKIKDLNVYDSFQQFLRTEEYFPSKGTKDKITEYDYIMNDMLKYNRYTDNLLRMQEDAQNPYMRGLFIAAFLRTVYALLEYPVNIAIKEDMIALLYRPGIIKDITKLADCTKLIEFNVASKYLAIMRHVLLNSKIYYRIAKEYYIKEVEIENEYLTRVGIIAYMIKKMVLVYKKIIKIEENDHKIFLSEISKCLSLICSELQFINFEDEDIRDKTLENFINFEIINIFIKIIKDYMNREALTLTPDKDEEITHDHILSDMVATISYIIGEYMSKCKKNSYAILEAFTRAYVFDKVKFRKTYLKEIIELSKFSDMKLLISKELNLKVSFISKVFLTDYNTRISDHRLMIITQNTIEFIYLGDNGKPEWEMTEFKRYQDKIETTTIDLVISFEYSNKILLKSEQGIFCFNFIKATLATNFIDAIKSVNPTVKVFTQVPMFPMEDQDEEIEDQEKANTMIFCVTQVKKFFDFFNFFKKAEIMPDGKVLLINENNFILYEELVSEWENINVKKIFETAANCKGNFLNIGNFSHCFKQVAIHDLDNMVKVLFPLNANELRIQFTEEVHITLLDDISYFRLTKILNAFARKKSLISKDNLYDKI